MKLGLRWTAKEAWAWKETICIGDSKIFEHNPMQTSHGTSKFQQSYPWNNSLKLWDGKLLRNTSVMSWSGTIKKILADSVRFCNEAISSVGGYVGDTKKLQEIVFVKLRLEFLVYWLQLKYLTHAHNKSLCLGEHVKLI